jgi:transposase
MNYFAGLDVSLKETALCVVDETGRIEARVASEPEALVAFFRASGMTMERVGLEACSLTAWLQQGLSEGGVPAICIEARQAKAAMGAMPNKTDGNDARGHRSDHAHRLVSCGAREEPVLPFLAGVADRTADGA